MKTNQILKIIPLFLTCITTLHAFENPTATSNSNQKQKIISLVHQAAIYIQTHGKEKSLAEFNKKSGKFSTNGTYIFALDYNGTFLATINYPELIGTNQIHLKDASGVYLVQEEIAKAKAGGGWLKARLKKNPYTGKLECKASLIQPMEGDYFIGSGYYYLPDKQGSCSNELGD